MDYLITIEAGKRLWMCLHDDGAIDPISYTMAAKMFIRETPALSKKCILSTRPRFIVAPENPMTILPFLFPFSMGAIPIYGVLQTVIAIDRNVLLLPHMDIIKHLKSTLDCM